MKNIELLKHLTGRLADISEDTLRAALVLESLNPDDEYIDLNKCRMYRLAILEIQMTVGIKSVTEGGYSISYSDAAVPAGLKALADQSGCKELIDMFRTQPKIKSKRYLWRK